MNTDSNEPRSPLLGNSFDKGHLGADLKARGDKTFASDMYFESKKNIEMNLLDIGNLSSKYTNSWKSDNY
jgi:hypothetical protein